MSAALTRKPVFLRILPAGLAHTPIRFGAPPRCGSLPTRRPRPGNERPGPSPLTQRKDHTMRYLLATFALFLAANANAAWDALEEVNAHRAARGLPPFIHDPHLARAAAGCADFRAARLMEGH